MSKRTFVEDIEYQDEDEDIYNKTTIADVDIGKKIMVNKEFRHILANCIITDNKKQKSVAYGGSCIIGSVTDMETNHTSKLKSLHDSDTVDLVSAIGSSKTKKSRKSQTKQKIYSSMEDFFDVNKPSKKNITFYYIADAHGNGSDVLIHWNCIVIDSKIKSILLYDPSNSGYNFNITKLDSTFKALKVYCPDFDTKIIKFDIPQQIICNSSYPGVDVFCQSWVMLFSAVYISGYMDDFAKIDFEKYQTMPLKLWLICMFERYNKKLQLELFEGVETENFFKYVILHVEKDEESSYVLANIPKIIDYGKKKPIIYSVIKNFSDPKSIHTYGTDMYKFRPDDYKSSSSSSSSSDSSDSSSDIADGYFIVNNNRKKISIDEMKTFNFDNAKSLKVVSKTIIKIPYIPSLTSLICEKCLSLDSIPELKNLENLTCIECPSLNSIPYLENLMMLTCEGCNALERIPVLKKLITLNCEYCGNLKVIPKLPELISLNCSNSVNITSIPKMPNLLRLTYTDLPDPVLSKARREMPRLQIIKGMMTSAP